tara:strand:- start:274 stop:900 length:627 start_codon:yes stop_codon:yes gene_type:complete
MPSIPYNFTLIEDFADASRDFKYFYRDVSGGCPPSDLLGGVMRRRIQEPLTETTYVRDTLGMRRQSMRDRWKEIVKLASDKPAALGFIKVEGGLSGLAEDIGAEPETLFRNLVNWSQRESPLVNVGHMKEDGLKPQISQVQVPLLTEWLLFAASARAYKTGNMKNAASWSQVYEIVELCIPIGFPAPPHNEMLYWKDAEKIIRQLKKQ